MSNTNNKIIAVVGATGNQGGSVTRHLIKNGWKIRALTRNKKSEKSQKLHSLGPNVEIVQAELSDIDSLKKALSGIYGVFLCYNFFRIWNRC